MSVCSALFIVFGLFCAASAFADTLSGTVKDPSGAVVVGARIEITGGSLSQPLVVTSDASGKFSAPNLASGKYSVRVAKEGFEEFITPVDLHGVSDLSVSLKIAEQQTQVTVTDKNMAFANSDPVYRQLRDAPLGNSYHCENFTLTLDVGTFEFKSGTFTLFNPVYNFETGLIFIGTGHFSLKPFLAIDKQEMIRRSGGPTAEEDFSEVVFRFTPNQFKQFANGLGPKMETPPQASVAFQHFKERLRSRHEVPEGFTQAILEDETILDREPKKVTINAYKDILER